MYEKFSELLQQKGITAKKVADDTRIATSTLSEWKAGLYTPKVDKLMILAKYFGVPLEYFLEEETE